MTFEEWSENNFIPCDKEYAKRVWAAATIVERKRCTNIVKAEQAKAMNITTDASFQLGRGITATLILNEIQIIGRV